jgi:hypothetical protein
MSDAKNSKSAKITSDNLKPSPAFIDNYSKVKWTSKKRVKKLYYQTINDMGRLMK